MTIDLELERHKRTWQGFTLFVKITSTAVAVLLALMAIFLL